MKSLFLTLTVLGCSILSTIADPNFLQPNNNGMEQLYKDYMQKYNRQYTCGDDYKYHLALFTRSYLSMLQHNQ